MCTPPRTDPVPLQQSQPARPSVASDKPSKRAEGHCRWIDHRGVEWMFTRANGSLIVKRPNARGSVAIRFPDPVSQGGRSEETWVLVEIDDGNVFQCGVSNAAHPAGEITSRGPVPHWTGVNDSVRTWFEGAEPID